MPENDIGHPNWTPEEILTRSIEVAQQLGKVIPLDISIRINEQEPFHLAHITFLHVSPNLARHRQILVFIQVPAAFRIQHSGILPFFLQFLYLGIEFELGVVLAFVRGEIGEDVEDGDGVYFLSQVGEDEDVFFGNGGEEGVELVFQTGDLLGTAGLDDNEDILRDGSSWSCTGFVEEGGGTACPRPDIV